MADNRYSELLGLAEEIEDPDYYQLLDLPRGVVDAVSVEEQFKQQMSKLQQIHSPKHKEFIEFLKGELKKSRGVLTDRMRRGQYDKELKDERMVELAKLASHMLIDGTLSRQGETSLVEEGKRLGLQLPDIKKCIDEEVKKRGARRADTKMTDAGSQEKSNTMIRDLAKDLTDARIAARFAEAKAKHAENVRERAEEQALVALKRAKDAQVLVRQAITRGSLEQAHEEKEREHVEEQLEGAQLQLAAKDKEMAELRKRLETQAAMLVEAEAALNRGASGTERPLRIAMSVISALTGLIVGHAVRAFVPGTAEKFADAADRLLALGTPKVAGVGGGAALVLVLLVTWFAAFPGKTAWMVVSAILTLVCAAAGGLFLR